ncbi:MAG: glycosyltransferase [Acidimicrobiales bacterium]
MRVALAHDYLTQRGGAERVVLSMRKAFPQAPVHTSLYRPDLTFPEFGSQEVHTSPLQRAGALLDDHRRALPLLAWTFGRLRVDADVVLCSSSGWAHGLRTSGRKIVYCYTPARWLYQTQRYLGDASAGVRATLAVLAPALRHWDHRAARSADRYLTSSTAVQERIRELYGIESTLVPPPHTIDPKGPQEPVIDLAPGYVLCVARFRPYKNIDVVVSAFRSLVGERLVVVGEGPDRARLEASAGPNVRFIGGVDDAQLRWLYAKCAGVVAASYEDYGLTPLEGAAFAKPSAVLRWGGFLDTVQANRTGVFFDQPDAGSVAEAVKELLGRSWDDVHILAHAERFNEQRFIDRLRSVVAEEAGARTGSARRRSGESTSPPEAQIG